MAIESDVDTTLRAKDACRDQMTVSPHPAMHPVLKVVSRLSLFPGKQRQGVLTWAVETPACCDIKHCPRDSEQNSPAEVTTKFCERPRGIGRKEQCRSV